MSKVRIIVPVYQAEKTLRRCLDTIVAQTFSEFEAVLVDDGSTDGSGIILEEYAQKDSRFIVLTQKNRGVAAARNAGLAYNGQTMDYVFFLDSDDWIEKNTVEALYAIAVTEKAQIVQCKFCYDYENGAVYEPSDVFPNHTILEQRQFKKTIYWKMMTGVGMNHVHHTLYEANLIKGITMPTHMRTGEDLWYNMEVYPCAERYVYCNTPFYHYFRGEDGLTGSSLSIKKKFQCNWLLAKKMAQCLTQWKMDTPFYHIVVYTRPFFLIFSKVSRMIHNFFMRKKGI